VTRSLELSIGRQPVGGQNNGEYCSAWHVNPYDEFWRQEVDKFVEPMIEELEMEKVRRKYFADIPYG
ncbi:hypothetical protein WAI453_006593, partial [Rhynchosporium graminicola]